MRSCDQEILDLMTLAQVIQRECGGERVVIRRMSSGDQRFDSPATGPEKRGREKGCWGGGAGDKGVVSKDHGFDYLPSAKKKSKDSCANL